MVYGKRASIEPVYQVNTKDDQQNNAEDLLVVLRDDSWEENIEVRGLVVCVAARNRGEWALPGICHNDNNLGTDQEQCDVQEGVGSHGDGTVSDVEYGYGHDEPNECMNISNKGEHVTLPMS
jgi:hypothetical protein